MYCNDMELSECQGATWCKIRSVLNPKSAPYNYPTLVSKDEGRIKTRSVITIEKLETFESQLEGVFSNEIENNVFDEVKTDVNTELYQPVDRCQIWAFSDRHQRPTCKRTQMRGCPESCRVEICH